MRFSLRVKLALVSLLLLLFPLLGMRLNAALKKSLLASQEDTLTFTTQAVAAALANRSDLFVREQFHALDPERDLYLFRLSNTIRLDGRLDDWQPELAQAEQFGAEHLLNPDGNHATPTLGFRYLAGKQGRFLYLLFDVEDDRVVLRSRKSLRVDRADHLQIIIERGGEQRRYLVSTREPGWVNGFLVPRDSSRFPVLEPRIQGVWQQTEKGYVLELRIPLDMLGSRLAFGVADVDDPQTRRVISVIGTADLARDPEPGRLLATSREIEAILKSLDRPFARIRIVDQNQRVRAQVGSLRREHEPLHPPELGARLLAWGRRLLQPLYRIFTTPFSVNIQDPASQPRALDLQGVREGLAGKSSLTRYRIADGRVEVMAAIAPLREKEEIVGAVVVEQTTNSILALSNRLIEETLTLSILAFLLGGGILFLFAFRISARIRRLRNQAGASIGRDGRIRNLITRTRAGDEIGDLEKTLAAMLDQLGQQVEHREKMADNLEHEMRTPLAGIAASLKNIEQELDDPELQIREYLSWAGRDVQRLEGLLTSIREATSLEQSLCQESRERFDLGRAVVLWLEHGWQLSFPDVEFSCRVPGEPLEVMGDPGRLRQALDKLVENAVSFHTPGTPVELILEQAGGRVSIRVENQGPVIGPELQQQIFGSMVSVRPVQDGQPHLGLGLYIVRTIVEHHRGTVEVRNLDPPKQGVVFILSLPLAGSSG